MGDDIFDPVEFFKHYYSYMSPNALNSMVMTKNYRQFNDYMKSTAGAIVPEYALRLALGSATLDEWGFSDKHPALCKQLHSIVIDNVESLEFLDVSAIGVIWSWVLEAGNGSNIVYKTLKNVNNQILALNYILDAIEGAVIFMEYQVD